MMIVDHDIQRSLDRVEQSLQGARDGFARWTGELKERQVERREERAALRAEKQAAQQAEAPKATPARASAAASPKKSSKVSSQPPLPPRLPLLHPHRRRPPSGRTPAAPA